MITVHLRKHLVGLEISAEKKLAVHAVHTKCVSFMISYLHVLRIFIILNQYIEHCAILLDICCYMK